MKKFKIGLYSPYLDTLGGGEKYMLSIAEVLSKESSVDFILDSHLASQDIEKLRDKAKLLHELDLSNINFIKGPFGKNSSFISRLIFLANYDYFIYLTDGSVFYSTAKNNLIHFQVPFNNESKSLWSQLKLSTFKKAIFNSLFTKKIVEKTWAINGVVVYPPVSIEKLKVLEKKKQILSVGRFFGYLKDKKHEFMIDAFKKLYKQQKLADWSFHLVGAASDGDSSYIKELEKQASGYPIFLHPNMSRQNLIKLYGESSIYWHASGFGETDPTKMEHFGISTVEAMASGCVPVVIKKGGQLEIVEEGISGLFWESEDELKNKTISLIEDSKQLSLISKKAVERSKEFSKEKFEKNILNLIYGKG